MFSKASFFLAFVAVAQVVVASPPGCLLGAINTYDTPSDLAAVCKSKDATTNIQKFCGDKTADALSAFADICNSAGVEVSTALPSGTVSTAKPTGTGSHSNSAHGTVSATITLASATGTGAVAPPTGTGNGGAARLEFAGAALLAGIVAVAL